MDAKPSKIGPRPPQFRSTTVEFARASECPGLRVLQVLLVIRAAHVQALLQESARLRGGVLLRVRSCGRRSGFGQWSGRDTWLRTRRSLHVTSPLRQDACWRCLLARRAWSSGHIQHPRSWPVWSWAARPSHSARHDAADMGGGAVCLPTALQARSPRQAQAGALSVQRAPTGRDAAVSTLFVKFVSRHILFSALEDLTAKMRRDGLARSLEG